MSFYAKDSVLTFKWIINPTASPLIKTDYDVTLTLPDGTSTYTDDGVTTYVAPTATVQGEVTYDLTPALTGRYQVTLSDGTDSAHIVHAKRDVYIVIPPAYVLSGTDPKLTQGPGVYPVPLVWGATGNTFSVNSLDTAGRSLFTRPDNTKLFYLGGSSSTIYEIDLTANLLNTAAYNGIAINTTAQNNDMQCGRWNGNGTELWTSAAAGNGNNFMYKYSGFTVPYALAGGSYASVSVLGSVFALTQQYRFTFGDSGNSIYVSDSAVADRIYRYTLTTPYNPAGTVTPTGQFLQLGTSPQATLFREFWVSDNGSTMWVEQLTTSGGVTGYVIQVYTMSTAFNPSTAVLTSTIDLTATSAGAGFCFGTKTFLNDWLIFNDTATTDTLTEYLLE